MQHLSEQRRQLLLSIRSSGAASVAELATTVGLSKTAARAHLLGLEEDGLIERAAPGRSGVGRPPLTFRISDAGNALFPSDEGVLLGRLLGHLDASGQSALVAEFFSDVWREREAAFDEEVSRSDGSLEARVRALRVVLERYDFMPQITTGGRGVVVRECNCPFRGAIDVTRVPCRLEASFLKRAIGGRLSSTTIAPGREGCRFEFELSGGG